MVILQISHACATDLQRFPLLTRRLEEVVGKFLRDGVKPAERMIANLIGMEVFIFRWFLLPAFVAFYFGILVTFCLPILIDIYYSP